MEEALAAGKDEVMKVKARYDALHEEMAALGRQREQWQAEEAEGRERMEEERKQMDTAVKVCCQVDCHAVFTISNLSFALVAVQGKTKLSIKAVHCCVCIALQLAQLKESQQISQHLKLTFAG